LLLVHLHANPVIVLLFYANFVRYHGKYSFDAFSHKRSVMTRSPGLGEVLPRLAVPTTILMGAEDRLYPVERMRPLAERAPAARLEVVPSCGHLAPLEAPEAVVAALRRLAAEASCEFSS
jgi:pimeloyl-ACP methyl ester carboxylesterase